MQGRLGNIQKEERADNKRKPEEDSMEEKLADGMNKRTKSGVQTSKNISQDVPKVENAREKDKEEVMQQESKGEDCKAPFAATGQGTGSTQVEDAMENGREIYNLQEETEELDFDVADLDEDWDWPDWR